MGQVTFAVNDSPQRDVEKAVFCSIFPDCRVEAASLSGVFAHGGKHGASPGRGRSFVDLDVA